MRDLVKPLADGGVETSAEETAVVFVTPDAIRPERPGVENPREPSEISGLEDWKELSGRALSAADILDLMAEVSKFNT